MRLASEMLVGFFFIDLQKLVPFYQGGSCADGRADRLVDVELVIYLLCRHAASLPEEK